MLKADTIKQADAVKKLFCEPFEKLKRFPMSKDESEMMIKLLLSRITIPEKGKPQIVQLLEKRVEHCFTFKLKDPKLILFLCFLAETPAWVVMYLTYLQYWAKKTNIKELNFDIFCERIFPFGFPSNTELSLLWDSVKVYRSGEMRSDNLLDYQTALASIQFAESKSSLTPAV